MRITAAPAPPITSKSLLSIFVVIGALCLAFAFTYPNLAFVAKNLVFVFLLVVTPAITKGTLELVLPPAGHDDPNDEMRRLARVFMESTLFIFIIYFLVWWIAAQRMSWVALGYAAALVVLVEAGAQFIEWHKARILNRVRTRSGSMALPELDLKATDLEELFKQGPLLYASVPLGIMIGVAVSLIKKHSPPTSLMLSLQWVLLIAACGLAYFLVRSFLRMIGPMFVEAKISTPRVVAKSTDRKTIIGFVKPATVEVPPAPNEREAKKTKEQQLKQDLDLSVIVSDLRKVYLYDAVHNVILLVLVIVLVSNAVGRSLPSKWWIISFVAATFLLTQLPYAVGQKLMHDRVLRRFEGTELVDMKAKLKKFAPALPKSEFVAAMIASNTAGGFLYFLFNEFLKTQTK